MKLMVSVLINYTINSKKIISLDRSLKVGINSDFLMGFDFIKTKEGYDWNPHKSDKFSKYYTPFFQRGSCSLKGLFIFQSTITHLSRTKLSQPKTESRQY